jgi:methylmalonyl-CoA mutase cobalamin-binding subunit
LATFINLLAAAIQQRVTAVLRSIPKETFADSFQKIYERCQQCVVKDGDYFAGQSSEVICIFCFVFLVPFTEPF